MFQLIFVNEVKDTFVYVEEDRYNSTVINFQGNNFRNFIHTGEYYRRYETISSEY